MADEKDEKKVDAELLDDLMKVDGDFAHKGDKVSLTERSFSRLEALGSVRKWGQSDKKTGDSKSDRATEAAQRKQAEVHQPAEPAEAVAVARVEGQSSKQQAQQRR